MRVLVTGSKGQLGYDVIRLLRLDNIESLGIDRNEVDITNQEMIEEFILSYKPSVVIHCAAYTAVDKAEDEKEVCHTINVLGTRYIAEACKKVNAKMVYISTDYVFDGDGEIPFEVTDKPNPINYYGKSKFEGELEVQRILNSHFIVRVSWVFGINGNNFVKTMLKLAKERDEISVVADQIGSPTYTYDLAGFLIQMIKTEKYGIYHATNDGYCSWYDFACEIFIQAGINIKVNPINTAAYPTKAKRPGNSKMSKARMHENFSFRFPTWQRALEVFINEDRKSVV